MPDARTKRIITGPGAANGAIAFFRKSLKAHRSGGLSRRRAGRRATDARRGSRARRVAERDAGEEPDRREAAGELTAPKLDRDRARAGIGHAPAKPEEQA